MRRTAEGQTRVKRTPIGSRNVLTVVGKDPNYEYRIVTDAGDRIQQFLEAGYELVDGKGVSVGDRRLDNPSAEGTKAQVSVGAGQKAFLMRIPKEFYEEDQAAKAARVKELENAIKNPGSGDYGKVELTRP